MENVLFSKRALRLLNELTYPWKSGRVKPTEAVARALERWRLRG